MTAAPLRFGLVGCGRIGVTADDRAKRWPTSLQDAWIPYAHASAIAATPGLELVAVCDVVADAAKAAAERFGGTPYEDTARMFERERLDGVAIATRTAERPALARAAIAAGVRAIYCEKPIATTLEAADDVAALIRERSVAFGYGTRRRHMEAYRRAREHVRAGAIGELQTIIVKFGRGALMWNHPHSVDIAMFFADDAAITSVKADLVLGDGAPAVLEDGARVDLDPVVLNARLELASGVDAVILAADSQDVELVGDKGILTVRQDGIALGWRTLDSERNDIGWLLGERVEPVETTVSGTVRGLELLAAAVRSGRPDDAELTAALRSHEALFAFVESHYARGARVDLPLPRRGIEVTGRVGTKYC